MFKIKTSMFSTIDKIFHNHHFISTDCNYTIPNLHNQISTSTATSLPPKITFTLQKNQFLLLYIKCYEKPVSLILTNPRPI